ncbi:hypothetical protein LVB87_05870 [Lysobacter sp. KIS68-7]|uniref:hypothetical protein n=1 Tax=Lysobacter sp. KIS68-7 TaxID=2904252 RepID=UPI001E5CE051|nr:hypothetical protein [Lysobacter sp. KIS68-7]UHQ20669.1 hypothetical protein LVB87_05870 [Lysobacter sp. KIS68-7]
MSDFRRQFILHRDARLRWRWALYEDGMHQVAVGSGSHRTWEECIESARRVAGIAGEADVWNAAHQRWVDEAVDRAPAVAVG